MALQTPYTNEQMLRLLALAHRHSNPNLLDNWCFGNPVDQRGGYVVPPNTPYWSAMVDGTSPGNTDAYYKATVNATRSDWYEFTMNGTVYYVSDFHVVRGYVGAGYGIDRWKLAGAGSAVFVEESCIRLQSANSFYQPVENVEGLRGKTVIFSLLLECITPGTGHFGFISNGGWVQPVTNLPQTTGEKTVVSATITVPENAPDLLPWYYGAEGTDYKVYAAKLELGSTQTLARQDENGNWQLIDPLPNKQQELAKCQRFAFNPLTTAVYQVLGIASAVSATQAIVSLALPVTMRTATPSLRVSDVTKLYLQGDSYIPLTALSISSVSNSAAKLIATVASGLTVGRSYALTTADPLPTFLISSDL